MAGGKTSVTFPKARPVEKRIGKRIKDAVEKAPSGSLID